MDPMQPINGVSLEQYAELCVAMMNTGGDEAKEFEIAATGGVQAADWKAAKEGWTARMMDAATAGQVATAFMPLYQAAQSRNRGGGEPMSLEGYTKIAAEYSFLKDESGQQINIDVLLARYDLNRTTWGEITGYWTPKVYDQNDPAAAQFRELMQKESDRIFGIVR